MEMRKEMDKQLKNLEFLGSTYVESLANVTWQHFVSLSNLV